jgi:tripartite-type tricarboxylate transporter receptor subunit TctC
MSSQRRLHAQENNMTYLVPTIVALCLGFSAGQSANAQSYPDKSIRIIVPSAPGGPTDVPARLASQILQPKLGQPIVVENRPGAAGALGARSVLSAPADGYTLLAGNTSVLAVIPAVSASAGYDPTRNFTAVAKVSESYQILVVHPSSPWKTVRDLVDYAKANPAKLNYAHTGAGGLPHLTGELFLLRAGVNMVGVPFRSGGESVTGVLNQAVHLTFESITILLPLIREGEAAQRSPSQYGANPISARVAHHGRSGRAGLRGYHVQRHRRAGRDACGHRRTQCGDECGSNGPR